jgi:predicted component of type VI protein secretion system
MTLELRIAGPGLDVVRVVMPSDQPLLLGRDAECSVCLPDPERNVSRHHLSVWNEGGELHFQVLSVVNGVELATGEVPPGARGVLAPGQTLRIAAYSLTIGASDATQTSGTDPWAALDREASGITPLVVAAGPEQGPGGPDDDPFGDWGFQSTFGPGAPGSGGMQAGQLGVARDIGAFFKGLGMDPAKVGALSEGELEDIGRMVRVALLGLMELQSQAFQAKQDLGADDRTMVASKDRNPLTGNWPDHTKLHYLFGGRVAAAGFVAPERAVRDVAGNLLAHQFATTEAVRLALQGLAAEFEPEALKVRLLGSGGGRLFGSARAWDAFVRHYEERSREPGGWEQHGLNRHFMETYLREFLRVKDDSAGRLR